MKKLLLLLTTIAISVLLAQPAVAVDAGTSDTTAAAAESSPPAPSAEEVEKEPAVEEVKQVEEAIPEEPPPMVPEQKPEPEPPAPPVEPDEQADDKAGPVARKVADPAPKAEADEAPKAKVAPAAAPAPKVWVCKYVGTPGVDERLKDGKNPISVSANALPGSPDDPQVGDDFSDAHERSHVVQIGGADPGVAACPPGDADTEVTTEDPLLIPPTCMDDGLVDVPTTPGVVYTITPSNTPGDVDVDATAVDGYVLSPASVTHWDFLVEAQLTGPVDCPVIVDPDPDPDSTNVKICHATAAFNNPYNVIPPATAGVANGHDEQHNGPIFNGVDVGWGDIIEPYTYLGVDYPGQNWTAEGQAIFDNGCVAVLPVVPAAPAIANACGEDGHVTIPPDTDEIHYAYTTGDGVTGVWEITATAQPGYYFADGVDPTSDGVVMPVGICVVDQEVVPLVSTADTCDGGDVPTPVAVGGVAYDFTIGDGVTGAWTITAAALPGYVFSGGTQFVFSGDAGSGDDCLLPDGAEVDPEVGVLDNVAREDDLLPDTGGLPLWMLLLSGPLTAAGLLILMSRRPVAHAFTGSAGPAYSLTMPPRHKAVQVFTVVEAPRGFFRAALAAVVSFFRGGRA